jgi:acyl-CoA reductase-like NAD-dependent aldehyde dehydrogenase
MIQSGFDSGEYQNVFTSHEQMDQILSHDSVGGVSFTGSSRAGPLLQVKLVNI